MLHSAYRWLLFSVIMAQLLAVLIVVGATTVWAKENGDEACVRASIQLTQQAGSVYSSFVNTCAKPVKVSYCVVYGNDRRIVSSVAQPGEYKSIKLGPENPKPTDLIWSTDDRPCD